MSETPTVSTVRMPSVKIASRTELRSLINEAHMYNFNRQAPAEVSGGLDPDGVNVLSMMVAYHDRSGRPDIDANADPVHHRVSVMAAIRDQDEPWAFLMDISEARWDSLRDAPTVREVIDGRHTG